MSVHQVAERIDQKGHESFLQPEVSIITPLYNAEDYISSTADSVFSQTFTNFEWIIADDCSTDNSREILFELEKKDSRVKVIYLKKNGGPIIARNSAIEIAKGRFVAFIDSDDLWLPQKLEKQLNLMKKYSAPLSYTGFKKIDKFGELRNGKIMTVPERVSYKMSLKSHSIVASSAVYDTNLTGNIKQSVEAPLGKDDLHFFLGILEKNGDAIGVQEDLTRLRIHGESLTGNKVGAAKKQWYFYRSFMKLSLLKSLYCFSVYAVKGFIKYIK